MKPLLVSYSDTGGAGRAACRLQQSLQASNIDSRLIVRRKMSDHVWVEGPPPVTGLLSRRRRIESLLLRLRPDAEAVCSTNLIPTRWSRRINREHADVVNVHWVGEGALSIGDLPRITPPVVMTLHDMWAFCGTEHYTDDTANAPWRRGYTREPGQRGGVGFNLDGFVWHRKYRQWSPMQVVAPSRWLATCASESALMQGWPVRVIPNPLDLDVFRPVDKLQARQSLGLPPDVQLISFGGHAVAQGPDARRKGYDLLVEAIARLPVDQRIMLAIFGATQPSVPLRLPQPVRWFGWLDDSQLRLLYSAADVMVVPSRQDNLPQTATEAQACGTPVVAFNTAGLADAVEHSRTGFLASPFSAEGLAQGIMWVLQDGSRQRRLSSAARDRAVRLWSPEAVVQQYCDVYRAAIESKYRFPRQARFGAG